MLVPTHFTNGGSNIYLQHPDDTIIPLNPTSAEMKRSFREPMYKREGRLRRLAGECVSKDCGHAKLQVQCDIAAGAMRALIQCLIHCKPPLLLLLLLLRLTTTESLVTRLFEFR